MTRTTVKNQVNEILRETAKGLHKDDFWAPVHDAFIKIRNAGFVLHVTGSRYTQDDTGTPNSKIWTYEIEFGSKKPISGVLTAHGAGTVADPLSRYDISAYVS